MRSIEPSYLAALLFTYVSPYYTTSGILVTQPPTPILDALELWPARLSIAPAVLACLVGGVA
jgi:hypothetical protein